MPDRPPSLESMIDPSASPQAGTASDALAIVKKPGPTIETLIGKDDRIRVTDEELKFLPYCAVCRITSVDAADASDVRHGTGWHAGKGVVVTAAHVAQYPWEKKRILTVELALHGEIPPIVRVGDLSSKTHTHIPSQWRNRTESSTYAELSAVHDYDYAIIRTNLHTAPGGPQASWLIASQVTDARDLVGKTAGTAGYDKWPVMLRNANEVQKSSLSGQHALRLFDHNIDTVPGASGSPIYRKTDGKSLEVIGIHTQGVDTLRNRAIAIHPDMMAALNSAFTAAGGSFDVG